MGNWGDGGYWGDGGHWGDSLPEVRERRHLSLVIHTAAGTDFVTNSVDTSWRIERLTGERVGRLYVTLRTTAVTGIATDDEVTVTDMAQVRAFTGFVETVVQEVDGTEIVTTIVAVDYSYILRHPEGVGSDVAISMVFDQGVTDKFIIESVIQKWCPTIGTDNVSELITVVMGGMTNVYFNNKMPWEIIEWVARQSGAVWWVDCEAAGEFKANLYYIDPGAAESTGITLQDGVIVTPPPYPYSNLRVSDRAGVSKVTVKGQPVSVSNPSRIVYPQLDKDGGQRERLDIPYRITPPSAAYSTPLVYEYGVTQINVGNAAANEYLGGPHPDGGTIDVLWYPNLRYLEFAVAPVVYHTVDCNEWREPTGIAEDLTAPVTRSITVEENTIYDAGAAQLRAEELLAAWQGGQRTIGLTCAVAAVEQVGKTLTLVSGKLGISDDYMIRSVTTRCIGGDLFEYDLVLGRFVPSTGDILRETVTVKMGSGEHSELWEGTGGLGIGGTGSGTDNRIVRWDGPNSIQDSRVELNDDDVMAWVTGLFAQGPYDALACLSEGAFTTHVKWSTTGDFDDTGGNAEYTHNTGVGTLTQVEEDMAVAGIPHRTYTFGYTVSGYSGDGVAEITTAFASVAVPLNLAAGTYAVVVTSNSDPGDFVISATSTSGGFILDNLSLVENTGYYKWDSGVALRDYSLLELHQSGTLEMIHGGTDSRPSLVLTGYNDQIDYPPRIVFRKSASDTLGTLSALADDTEFGRIEWWGVDIEGKWELGAYIETKNYDILADPGDLEACLHIWADEWIWLDGYDYVYISASGGASPDIQLVAEDNIKLDASGEIRLTSTSPLRIYGNVLDFRMTMGNSSKDPTTDAPTDWVEVQIAGATVYVPGYAA